MKNNRRLMWLLTVIVLMAALTLSVGTAYARYRTEILGDLAFQVKPLEQLTFASQQWEQSEDGSHVLTFTMAEAAQSCRMYLAVSEGITVPASLTVTLTMPPEEGQQTQTQTETQPPAGTEPETPAEPIVLTAVMEQITEGSSLYALFGSGYVFRFCNAETGEEMFLDLTTDFTYTLTVSGLQSAAAQTSLLRLFVEYAQK